MLSASVEDYLKAIFLLEAEHERATTQRLAGWLGVKMPSVSGMVKHLAAEGFVRHSPYYGVRLTSRGRSVAVNMIRRHRLIELFLATTLGLGWDEIHPSAEVLEHAFSDDIIDRIDERLGRPQFDPHGQPIPRKDGSTTRLEGVALSEMPRGRRCVSSRSTTVTPICCAA